MGSGAKYLYLWATEMCAAVEIERYKRFIDRLCCSISVHYASVLGALRMYIAKENGWMDGPSILGPPFHIGLRWTPKSRQPATSHTRANISQRWHFRTLRATFRNILCEGADTHNIYTLYIVNCNWTQHTNIYLFVNMLVIYLDERTFTCENLPVAQVAAAWATTYIFIRLLSVNSLPYSQPTIWCSLRKDTQNALYAFSFV